jgi:hypothetical protein
MVCHRTLSFTLRSSPGFLAGFGANKASCSKLTHSQSRETGLREKSSRKNGTGHWAYQQFSPPNVNPVLEPMFDSSEKTVKLSNCKDF